ncbi:flagellar hook-length control protein FliK [Rhodobacteraceae bacterium B1Z28]|uniref:Flagellar hook-length control protein FliK n=1 Tax=Ruegeria haliotis TaxID=2747601 RepID=A0ABX2PWE8_9RHOB|nr:flagellar hook-length control protein FliK [Ruegeria haliotis]NVO57666.1 flagellar hook-length control protein FliK [Ruegeria haliotis]
MPNSLMLATTTPTTTAKADTSQRDQRDSKGSMNFQDVLNQEATPSETETEIEIEETSGIAPEPEVELVDVEVAPSEQLDLMAGARADQPMRSVEGTNIMSPDPNHAPEIGTLNPAPLNSTDISLEIAPDKDQQQGLVKVDLSIPTGSRHPTPVLATDKGVHPQMSAKIRPEIGAPEGKAPAQQTLSAAPDARPAVTPPAKEMAQTDGLQPSVTLPGPRPKPQLPERGPTVAQIQLMASAKSTETEKTAPVPEAEGLFAARDEPTLQSARDTAPQLNATTATARTEVARAIANQMATAIHSRPGSGVVEIALNPEELGRVSIVLNSREDGLHLTIAAERPETLDLMRRHIADLTAEFQKLGYGELSFDLGTSPNPHHDDTDARAGSFFEPASDEHDTQTAPALQRTAPGRGIDMRL